MKSILRSSLLVVLFSAIGFTAVAQNRITKEIIEFHKVYVKGKIEVELIPSNANEITLSSRYIPLEEVEVEFKDNSIYIKTKPKLNSEENVKVKLPYKNITVIEVATGAIVNSARDVESSSLFLKATSGGKIELSIQTDSVLAEVSQLSDIILYGSTKIQEVDLNTGGNYLAYDLDCERTTIKATAGSQGKVIANKAIDANSGSKAFIGYIGNPSTTNIKTSLGGEISAFKTREDANN